MKSHHVFWGVEDQNLKWVYEPKKSFRNTWGMTPGPTTHNDSKGVEMCFKTRPSLTFFGDKQFLVGGWVWTHLKNMRKSNWIIFPGFRAENKKIFELPPPRVFFRLFKHIPLFWINLTKEILLGDEEKEKWGHCNVTFILWIYPPPRISVATRMTWNLFLG